MEGQPRGHFIDLRTDGSQRGLNPAIAELLHETGLPITSPKVIRLASDLQRNPETTLPRFLQIESAIGGVGLHNINRQEGRSLAGAYRSEYRPIFRPIQYATRDLFDQDLEWDARHIVQWSCGHVEDAMKYRFDIPDDDRVSLGILLTRRPSIKRALDIRLQDWLRTVNRVIYRNSKHAMEDVGIDVHLFTPPDAVATYVMCRWAGVQLLEPTAIFSGWQRPFDPA